MPISDRSNSTCYTYDVSSFLGYKTVVTVHYERASRKKGARTKRSVTYTLHGAGRLDGPGPAFNADLSTQINRVSRGPLEETCVKRDKGPLFGRKAVHCDLTKLTFAHCKAR